MNYPSLSSTLIYLLYWIVSLHSILSRIKSRSGSVRHIGCFCKALFYWFLLHTLLAICFASAAVVTYIHVCTIVSVVKIISFCCCGFSQYHFGLSFMQFMYCSLTNSESAVLIFPSQVVYYCSFRILKIIL